MAPSTSSRIRKPTRIDSGTPTKNTCICGISRDSTPSPRLNRRPNTRNGAESWMPMRNAPATVRGHQRGDVADQRHLARAEQRVAVVERGDHQVMQVGGEDQRDAEHGEEIADDHALLALRRIDRGDEAEPELLGDDRAGDLQRRDREPRGQSRAPRRSAAPGRASAAPGRASAGRSDRRRGAAAAAPR